MLHFHGGTTAGTMDAYIGEAATTGNPTDFDGDQVHETFSGVAPLTGINGATTICGDYVPLTVSASKNLVVSMLYGGTTVNVGSNGATVPTIGVYYCNTVVTPGATVAAGLTLQAASALTAGEVDFIAGSASAPISGATAQTFTPTATQLGDALTVSVTAHNVTGPSLPSTSAATTSAVIP